MDDTDMTDTPLFLFSRGPLSYVLERPLWRLWMDPSLGLSWFSSQLEVEQVARASRCNQEHTSGFLTSSLHKSTGKRNFKAKRRKLYTVYRPSQISRMTHGQLVGVLNCLRPVDHGEDNGPGSTSKYFQPNLS